MGQSREEEGVLQGQLSGTGESATREGNNHASPNDPREAKAGDDILRAGIKEKGNERKDHLLHARREGEEIGLRQSILKRRKIVK